MSIRLNLQPLVITVSGRKRKMLYSLKRLSPFRLLGQYSLARSVEELHQDKPLEHFRTLSCSNVTLQRCHSLPSVALTDALSISESCISQAGSLIDQVSCSQYLVPTLQRPSTDLSLSFSLSDHPVYRSSTSGTEDTEDSIINGGATSSPLEPNGSGYTSVKVRMLLH